MSGDQNPLPRTLLGGTRPPGFDEDGRRLLAECPEFRLYELFQEGGEQILERSKEVEKAYKKASFSINDAGKSEKRVAWAEALQDLADMGLGSYYGGLPLLRRVVDTIGKEVAEMLLDVESTPERAAAAFKSALIALKRRSLKVEYLLIIHAEGYFKAFRKRPTKGELIRKVEGLGFGFRGKNARGTWQEKFTLAGLSELPD